MSTCTTQRLLRLSVSLYRDQSKTGAEAHEFAVNNHAAQAAQIHAKHGIEMYIQYFSPAPLRAALDDINGRRNRGWVVDDHDMTVEFYFRSFAELNKVTNDPDFQRLQAEEESYVNSAHTVVSLGWVEKYVENGKVVNIKDGKTTYPSYDEASELYTAMSAPPISQGGTS